MASFQSSDDDWTFCSSKSVFSIDSGEESQISSNLRPPFTFLQTNESFDDSENMSFSTGSKDLNSSQAFRPHLTDINEWVQRQSEATQASLKPNANSNELPGSTSANPIPKSEVPAPPSEGFSQCSKLTPGSSSIYDISTLLELGTTTSSDQMELRIRPAALAGKTFVFGDLYAWLFFAVYVGLGSFILAPKLLLIRGVYEMFRRRFLSFSFLLYPHSFSFIAISNFPQYSY